jgi:ABC-2 type transport system ATP-binding protein
MARTTASNHGEPPIVLAQGLTKVFKDFWMRDRVRAVDSIDFHIERGEIFGLLGPNGSGKSTTIKMILGLLKKSSGRLAVFGKSPFEVATKKRIGYLPEESYLYPFLNARETLDYYAKLFKLDRRTRVRRIDELLDMVGLTAVQHRQVREYSKGMQRRIGIAQALINDPEFLILDEPTTGLDPIGTRQVKDLIIALGQRGKTILLSSHLLSDVEDCVSRMVILYGGKIRQEGTCDQLLTAHSRSLIETEALDEATIDDIRAVLRKHHKQVERVSAPRQKLEDLFIDIVKSAQAERLATSGATHAGATAAFLVEGSPQGRDLIESLTRRAAEPPVPPAERPMATESREPEEPHAPAIIDQLIAGPESFASPPETPPERRDKPEAPPPSEDEVDDSIIDSLLRGSSDDDDQDARRPGERAP